MYDLSRKKKGAKLEDWKISIIESIKLNLQTAFYI
jgi:hypothetical protein